MSMAITRAAMGLARSAGVDVFILPVEGEISGCSFARRQQKPDERLYITICGRLDHPLFLFVFAHEVAHHLLNHTTRWTSEPVWSVEYQADQMALAFIAMVLPEATPVCEAAARDHVRLLLQDYIDADIWNHVDIGVADWAGCAIPDDMRAELAEVAA